MRGDRPEEVAVRRVVTRRVPGQPHGVRRRAGVSPPCRAHIHPHHGMLETRLMCA